jgi:hypothetical protein
MFNALKLCKPAQSKRRRSGRTAAAHCTAHGIDGNQPQCLEAYCCCITTSVSVVILLLTAMQFLYARTVPLMQASSEGASPRSITLDETLILPYSPDAVAYSYTNLKQATTPPTTYSPTGSTTTSTAPTTPINSAAAAVSNEAQWFRYFDTDSGHPWFYNQLTAATAWELPEAESAWYAS